MKKLILIKAVLMTMFISIAVEGAGQTNIDSVIIEKSNEDKTENVIETRTNLLVAGYSSEMMNDLFGEENLYFPLNQKSLDMTIYIVDLLIENNQYEESEKSTLIEMANSAYAEYNEVSKLNVTSAQAK